MHLMTLALPQEPSDGIAGWAADLVDAMGGPGAGLAIALENLFPPLPSEVILPLTGFAAGQGVISLASALFWTTLGSVVGALVLYWIGMLVGRRRMHAIWAKLPLVKASDLDRTEQWFERHGTKAVFIGRMVPIFRSLISIPAGVERMPLPVFALLTTLGSLVWNTVLVMAGYWLGLRLLVPAPGDGVPVRRGQAELGGRVGGGGHEVLGAGGDSGEPAVRYEPGAAVHHRGQVTGVQQPGVDAVLLDVHITARVPGQQHRP